MDNLKMQSDIGMCIGLLQGVMLNLEHLIEIEEAGNEQHINKDGVLNVLTEVRNTLNKYYPDYSKEIFK